MKKPQKYPQRAKATLRWLSLLMVPTFALSHANALPLIDIERTLDIPSRTADAVEQKVLSDIEKRIEDNIQNNLPIQPALNKTLTPINKKTETLGNQTLAMLPPRIAIKDQAGASRFYDIRIAPNQRIIEQEWVIMHANQNADAPTPIQPNNLVRIIEKTHLPALNIQYTRLRVAASHDSEKAIRELLQLSNGAIIQRNYIFNRSAQSASTATPAAIIKNNPINCEKPLPIGLLDSAINSTHPAFNNTEIIQQSFTEKGLLEPQQHGTAVASILTTL